ncbi:YcxB family protein [Rhodobacteraceae bacterium]|nr:YcxB family protein [Paracoccaceae bacterium]
MTISYDRKLWRRGMTGWWRSVVPPQPFAQRAIFWAVIWVAIGALAGSMSLFGLPTGYVAAGLVGAGLLIGVFTYLQRTRMSRFWDVIGAHWDKAGVTQATFGPDGFLLIDEVSRREMSWTAIDAVKTVRGGTVLRSGISMTMVPDAALPEGTDAPAFRKMINTWRTL